jgi:hypothetical protein
MENVGSSPTRVAGGIMFKLIKVLFGEYPTYGVVYLNPADFPRMEKYNKFDTNFKTPSNLIGYKGRIWDNNVNMWSSQNTNKDTRIICVDDDVPVGFARIKLPDNSLFRIQL